ncbi:hypothetical protein V7056_04380 [Bacillus sp. JJ664]
MNWKKGGLWVLIFFIVKGTISTLLIVTGAKYFKLNFTEILMLVLVLLAISYIGRRLVKNRKKSTKQHDANM